MLTEIRLKNSHLFPEIVQRLEAGEVIVVPTDTTYAFIAHAFIPRAIERIMTLKRWPTPQPLGVFTCKEKARDVVVLNDSALRMMEHFPYPVTMILPKKDSLPEIISAGHKDIFIACPDRFIYDLILAVPFPIACASAGYGDMQATSAKAALQLFNDEVALIIDGGKGKYSRSGTLVDFTLERPTILKYGPVSVDDLRPILPTVELPSHLRK
jgi:L-threonylcarbamoyladenylate synthase